MKSEIAKFWDIAIGDNSALANAAKAALSECEKTINRLTAENAANGKYRRSLDDDHDAMAELLWECRPNCHADLPFETNLLLAIAAEDDVPEAPKGEGK